MANTSKLVTADRPNAFSYIRFSHPDQAAGDSLRRQAEAAAEWCRKHKVSLDTSTTFRDLGTSAYTGAHRTNPDRHALAAFLKLVESGRVPRGSFLIIENLDRLSREHIQPALLLALNLLQAGVRIVQLKPAEMIFDDRSEAMQVMMMVMELTRGHGESAMKADRVAAAWGENKRRAAESKVPLTGRVPAWLRVEGRRKEGQRVVGGRFVVDDAKGKAVRLVYQLAATGYGLWAITKKLNADGVPPIAGGEHWKRSYVSKLLRMRQVTGEYQPHAYQGRRRKPDGPPIPDYYPAVVTEDEWHAARAAAEARLRRGGRPSPRVNFLNGLLRDARDGGTLNQIHKGGRYGGAVLRPYRATNGAPGAKLTTFPLDVFERAILSRLREIDPRDVLPGGDGAAGRVLSLAGRQADIEARVAKVQSQILDGDDDLSAVVDTLRKLEARRAEAAAALAQAKREAASPLSEAWGECRSLLDTLDNAPDPADARVRLRALLRRMVDGVWCLLVASPPWRLAAVRVQFTGGEHRDYLIAHHPAVANKAGVCRAAYTQVCSFADAAPAAGDLDLRKRKDATKVVKLLESLDVAELGKQG